MQLLLSRLTTLGLLLFASGCTSQPLTQSFSNAPSPVTSNLVNFTDLEQATYQQVNQYRTSKKLVPLKLDSRVSEQARVHSQNMANGMVAFSHDGFDRRVELIAAKIPYRSVAENVAYNAGYTDPVPPAVNGWINSEGHRKNMLGNYDLTGIGIAKNAKGEYYFTQIFVHSR